MDTMGTIIFIILYLLVCLMCGLIAGYINKNKGCSYKIGFWCGFLLGIIGIIIVAVQENKNTSKNIIADADEIKKYKELLDNGVITQQEFEVKKKQLLGI